MATTYKKALSPAHPSEKLFGKAISPPPCEHGIPLYPLRYGIADSTWDAKTFPTLSTKGYPALNGGKAYGLRVLRPGTYVYLCYFRDGRMWTQHYLVTEQVRFARIWWSQKDYDDTTPGRQSRPDEAGAKTYLLAPETEKADTVYVLVSETVLTHRTLWHIETNKDGVRDRLATVCKPAGGAEQEHAFPAMLLGSATLELVPPAIYGTPMQYGWSEITFTENLPGYNRILSDMHIASLPRKDVTPLTVALQDPIGIVSELHYLTTGAVKKKAKFAGENAHKLQSGKFITSYFEAAGKGAKQSPELAGAIANQRSLVNYDSAIAFPGIYAKQIETFDAAINARVKDIVAWVRLMGTPELLGKALSCFDLGVLRNARDYETAVFNCLGGLVHAQEGRQALEQLVMAPPAQSPYWLALVNGCTVLATRIQEKTSDIAKNVFDVLDKYLEEHAATPTTNALVGLLQALPQNKQADILVRRLRHVMEIRFNATIVLYELSLADLARFAHEFQGYQTLGSDRLRGWRLPQPKVSQAQVAARVLIYDWVKIGETTYRELDRAPAERPALPPPRPIQVKGNLFIDMVERMRAGGGYFFTGLGGWLALKGLLDAWQQFNSPRDRIANLGSVAGAASAVVGAGIEIGATVVAFGAGARGNTALATSVKILAAKRGVAVFGAGGAGLAAAADAVRAISAFDDSNPELAFMYLGSAIAGGFMALAAWGGGTATAATLAGGAGPVAVLGLTPAGWAVVGLIAFGAGIAFVVGVDMTKHGPVEIWLKHSAWGVHRRHYTNREELDAIHSLYYRPRLSAEWEKASGYAVGTLRIHCQLPYVYDRPGERFQARLTFTQQGKALSRVNGPIAYPAGTSPIDYRRECLVTPLGYTGSECGWAIQMHEDTQVALEYLYLPDPIQQPGLALDQPGAPAPLVFSSGGLFTAPIDTAKLEPVGAPK